MIIALASPSFPNSISDGLYWIEKLVKEAATEGAEIICFPESFLPGYPGMNALKDDYTPENLQAALDKVCKIAADHVIAIIIPMDWPDKEGMLNVAQVISSAGEVLGYQTKNQLDPSEDLIWVAGKSRKMFEINGLKFGISICHEGFRYPESVRWAARNNAKIVFHPHFGGSNEEGAILTEWGDKNNPYYEKAMVMRALENSIYFASVNYASKYPDSASSVIDPEGTCIAHESYGRPGIIIANIYPEKATGLMAKRFKQNLYNNDVKR